MNSSIISRLMSRVSDFSMPRLALAGLIIAGFYFGTIYDDGEQIEIQIESLKKQIEEEKVKKLETNRVLQKEEQMRADVTMLVKKYEEVKSKIPIEFLESELRIIIDQFATQFELKTLKNQRATVGKDFGSSLDANLVEQVVLEYSFSGNFYNLEKLIKQIASTDKLIKIENLELSATEKRSDPDNPQDLILKATIIGFKQSTLALSENKNPVGGVK